MANPIDRIASAVSDGAPVDWVREKGARPSRLEEYDQLALVERIRRVHEASTREPPASPGSGEPDTETVTASSAAPDAVTTPLFFWGRLKVLEQVGAGGGGEVYRAIDPALKSEVALKLLRPDYGDSPNLIRRFLEEARRLARVHHQNVLTVHGADQHDGRAGLWTEFVHGKPLETYLAEQGPLSACEASVIGLDLCRALAAVHAAGLVHRDVKTTNVMRESGGRIVLMDFGSMAESPSFGPELRASGVQGTPISMAPEQLRGEVAGPATDIYGLGVLLYRLVTRRYPVEASSLNELGEKHRIRTQIPLRDRRADLPLEFVQVVERALRHDPSERYASTGAMERELASTLGAMAREQERRRRSQWMAVVAVAAVAVLAGLFLGRAFWGRTDGLGASRPAIAESGPPASAPLTAEVALVRHTADSEMGLATGGRVTPGDRLTLLVTGTDSMHVYVLNEDAEGEVFGLYPIPGLLPTNPLEGRIEHRLPGDLGEQMAYWSVTSAGGRESIIAIGSREPLPNLENVMAEMPRATPGRPIRFGRIDPMKLRNVRGIGSGDTMDPPRGEARRRLKAALEGLEKRGAETGDVWVWSIDLENPAPSPAPAP